MKTNSARFLAEWLDNSDIDLQYQHLLCNNCSVPTTGGVAGLYSEIDSNIVR